MGRILELIRALGEPLGSPMETKVVCSGIRQGRERKLLSLLDRNGSNSLDWRRCRWMPPNPAESAGRQWMQTRYLCDSVLWARRQH